MKKEILDLYNDNGQKINEIVERGMKTTSGKNIMLSIIFIENSDKKFLIQKNSKEKGSKFSTTGGHVWHNESSFNAIKREMFEELGIKFNDYEIKHIKTFKYSTKNCIFSVYYVRSDINIRDIKLQEEEVETVLFLSKNEIMELINNEKFLESHGYIFKNYIYEKCDV